MESLRLGGVPSLGGVFLEEKRSAEVVSTSSPVLEIDAFLRSNNATLPFLSRLESLWHFSLDYLIYRKSSFGDQFSLVLFNTIALFDAVRDFCTKDFFDTAYLIHSLEVDKFVEKDQVDLSRVIRAFNAFSKPFIEMGALLDRLHEHHDFFKVLTGSLKKVVLSEELHGLLTERISSSSQDETALELYLKNALCSRIQDFLLPYYREEGVLYSVGVERDLFERYLAVVVDSRFIDALTPEICSTRVLGFLAFSQEVFRLLEESKERQDVPLFIEGFLSLYQQRFESAYGEKLRVKIDSCLDEFKADRPFCEFLMRMRRAELLGDRVVDSLVCEILFLLIRRHAKAVGKEERFLEDSARCLFLDAVSTVRDDIELAFELTRSPLKIGTAMGGSAFLGTDVYQGMIENLRGLAKQLQDMAFLIASSQLDIARLYFECTAVNSPLRRLVFLFHMHVEETERQIRQIPDFILLASGGDRFCEYLASIRKKLGVVGDVVAQLGDEVDAYLGINARFNEESRVELRSFQSLYFPLEASFRQSCDYLTFHLSILACINRLFSKLSVESRAPHSQRMSAIYTYLGYAVSNASKATGMRSSSVYFRSLTFTSSVYAVKALLRNIFQDSQDGQFLAVMRAMDAFKRLHLSQIDPGFLLIPPLESVRIGELFDLAKMCVQESVYSREIVEEEYADHFFAILERGFCKIELSLHREVRVVFQLMRFILEDMEKIDLLSLNEQIVQKWFWQLFEIREDALACFRGQVALLDRSGDQGVDQKIIRSAQDDSVVLLMANHLFFQGQIFNVMIALLFQLRLERGWDFEGEVEAFISSDPFVKLTQSKKTSDKEFAITSASEGYAEIVQYQLLLSRQVEAEQAIEQGVLIYQRRMSEQIGFKRYLVVFEVLMQNSFRALLFESMTRDKELRAAKLDRGRLSRRSYDILLQMLGMIKQTARESYLHYINGSLELLFLAKRFFLMPKWSLENEAVARMPKGHKRSLSEIALSVQQQTLPLTEALREVQLIIRRNMRQWIASLLERKLILPSVFQGEFSSRSVGEFLQGQGGLLKEEEVAWLQEAKSYLEEWVEDKSLCELDAFIQSSRMSLTKRVDVEVFSAGYEKREGQFFSAYLGQYLKKKESLLKALERLNQTAGRLLPKAT